jgi:centrosomal CEP192-like protein
MTMSRSIVGNLRHVRLGVVALGLLAALLLAVPASAAACGEEGPEDTGPLVSEATLTPGSLPYGGGPAVLTARVEDDCGIQQVYAEVFSTEATSFGVQMLPYEVISGTAVVYRGEFQVPANFQEWEVGYQANVSAEDTNGAYAEAYAGELNVAGVPQFDEPPYVNAAVTTPNVWGAWGGATKVSVEASDTRSLANVYAIVTGPGGSETELPLEATSFSRFEGVLNVPANFTATAQTYSVEAFAEDDIGQTTSASAGTVTVEPKGTLHPGSLTLEPAALYFGPVSLGAAASQEIVLANTGKPGSPPVSGQLRLPSDQFTLAGASGGNLSFSLAPGEERIVTVGFQPSARGQQTARVALVRADGRQPNRGASLYGWGVK